MKRIFWTDKNDYRRCSVLRDEDDISRPEIGLPLEPPNIEDILDNSKKVLHNILVDRGLFTYSDVVKSQNGITAAILDALRTDLILAFKLKELNKNG